MELFSRVLFFLAVIKTLNCTEDVGISNRLSRLEQKVHQNDLLERKIKQLEEKTSRLEGLIQKLLQTNKNAEQKVHRRYTEVPIGFTAVIDNPAYFVDHVGLNTIVKFNKVLTNIGSGYNEHTGIFTAPYDGVYVFHFVASTSYGPEALWTRLIVDGVGQTGSVAKSIQDGQDLQGGNHAILQLRKGQAVWIEAFNFGDVHIFARDGFSSFTGYLLY